MNEIFIGMVLYIVKFYNLKFYSKIMIHLVILFLGGQERRDGGEGGAACWWGF